MPVYQHSKGKWRVRIWIKGRKQDWVVEGKKAEAEDFEARRRVELEAVDPTAPRTAPLLSDFCARQYKAHGESSLRPSTWRNRAYQLATIREHLGHLKLTEITTEAVEAFKHARVRQVKRVTVNDDLAVLQAVLTYARTINVPCARPKILFLKVPKPNKVQFWSTAEVEKLYRSAAKHAPDVLPLIVFLANTGCRKGEALALTWSNVDLERRMIKIWPNDEWQPKDGEPREVPISSALLPWLQGTRRSSTWVFPAPRTGKRWASWPKRGFDLARKKAKLTGGPHKLRHTYASHFLESTPDLFLLARVLGHSDTRVTRLYAHLMPGHLARARDAVSLAPPVGAAVTRAAARWGVDAKTVPGTVPENGKSGRRTG